MSQNARLLRRCFQHLKKSRPNSRRIAGEKWINDLLSRQNLPEQKESEERRELRSPYGQATTPLTLQPSAIL
jgi:hypothetical protein